MKSSSPSYATITSATLNLRTHDGGDGISLPTLTHIDQLVCQQLPQSSCVGVCGADHSQVAVQADEGQDEHAAIQVDRVDDVNANAGDRPQAPVSQGRIHGPEGQRQDEEEVGGREVEAVAIREAAL